MRIGALYFVLLVSLAVPAVAEDSVALSFQNDGITLKGTLYRAAGEGRHPAIVLLAGSGKATRDGVVFRTLEGRFLRLGIDVLAYDKRGSGESGGTYDDNTPLETLAADALAAVQALRARDDIDPERVGLWGISQGGYLGPLAASMSPDVAFVISVSGPGVSIAEQAIYLRANEMLAKGYSPADAARMTDFRSVLWAYYGTGLGREAAQAAMDIVKDDRWYKDEQLPQTVPDLASLDPGMRSFMREAATYDPLAIARKVRVPVLIIFGAKDSVVPAQESLANLLVAYGAGGNRHASFALFPDAGHGIQRVTTERECHECSERAMMQSGVWDATPGFFDLMDAWLRANVVARTGSSSVTALLPRSGSLGASLAIQNGRVVIAAVLPSSSAAQAGLRPSDALLRIDGAPVTSTQDVISQMHRAAGTVVRLVIARGEKQLTIPVTLLATPAETDAQVTTLYLAVSVDGTLRRILLDVPKGQTGPLPALMLIGGIGCYPIDTANPEDPYRNVARDVSRRGFVTLRLEKSGIRDSQGPACRDVDFKAELHSYDVALKWLLRSPLVDPSRVYVLGHSIGGVIAPRLAISNSVAGVIVADTVGINWFEYELINERRQLALAGETPAQVDTDMKVKETCTRWLEIDKMSYEAILARRPDCKQFLDVYPVSASYMQEVAALNIAAPWSQVRVPVLAIYGRSDFITDEAGHRTIVNIVNRAKPGLATLLTISNMDHYLVVSPSQQSSFDRATRNPMGTYDRKFSDAIIEWLCSKEPSCKALPVSRH
jgi:uncharacterized protein